MIDVLEAAISYDGDPSPWQEIRLIDKRVWKVKKTKVLVLNPVTGFEEARRWLTCTHKTNGLEIMGPTQRGPTILRASYPRLIWATANGRLVRSQAHLDQAGDQIESLLRQLSPGSSFQIAAIRRIELVWHFIGDHSAWISFYASLKHPRIEAFPVRWREEFQSNDFCINPACASDLRRRPIGVSHSPTAVTWNGDLLKIKLYDKAAQMGLRGRADPVMRLEFTLSKRLSAGLIGPNGRVLFSTLYSRYRELSGYFRDIRQNRSVNGSPIDFLLYLRVLGLIPEHMYQDFFLAQSRATRQRYNARVRSLSEVWEMVPGVITRLPESAPPDEAVSPDIVAPERFSARGFSDRRLTPQ